MLSSSTRLVGGVIHDGISSVESISEENRYHTKVFNSSNLSIAEKDGLKEVLHSLT